MRSEKEIREQYEYIKKRHKEDKLDQRRGYYHYQNEGRVTKEIELLEWVLSIDNNKVKTK